MRSSKVPKHMLVSAIIGCTLFAAMFGLVALFVFLFEQCWNLGMAPAFGLHAVTFWQAIAMVAFVIIVSCAWNGPSFKRTSDGASDDKGGDK